MPKFQAPGSNNVFDILVTNFLKFVQKCQNFQRDMILEFCFAFTSFHKLSLLENTNNTKHFMRMGEYFNILTALIGCFGTH